MNPPIYRVVGSHPERTWKRFYGTYYSLSIAKGQKTRRENNARGTEWTYEIQSATPDWKVQL